MRHETPRSNEGRRADSEALSTYLADADDRFGHASKVPMPMAAAAREALSTARTRRFGGLVAPRIVGCGAVGRIIEAYPTSKLRVSAVTQP